MPKVNTPRITEAQKQRHNIAKKSEKYGPSTVYLQVLGSGARGAPNTLYLFTDQKRYLFNCGESTQRLAHEHKVKLSRLDHIFITSKTWKNIGGLPGLSLTLQDVGVPNITLHGPDGLEELYSATKRFVIMKDMSVTMAKCSPTEDFEDNAMTVKYVLIGPEQNVLPNKELNPPAKKARIEEADEQFEEFIHDDTDYYGHKVNTKMSKDKKTKSPDRHIDTKLKAKPAIYEKGSTLAKKKIEQTLISLKPKANCSVSYICTLKKRLGTLDLAKCVERGVKPGPLLGQLKSGKDVMLPDGTLVLSQDVKTPDDPGPVFIVLDVPNIEYLKEEDFAAHFDTPENSPDNIPSLIVHYSQPDVIHHPTFQGFLNKFGPKTQHLIVNSQNSCMGSEAVHRTQHKLHLLDPEIFPLLKDSSIPAEWSQVDTPAPKTMSPLRQKGLEELKNKIAAAQFQSIISMEGGDRAADVAAPLAHASAAAKTLTIYHLRPKRELDRSHEPKLHIQEYIRETMDVEGFVTSLECFRRVVDAARYKRADSRETPKLVFLGTGSCIPSKTRNTSAIMLHIDEDRSMLLDCGEGTLSQMIRFYGPKRVNAVLRSLRALYVSHLHADHHMGLIGIIQARRQAFEEISQERPPEPLYLLAPGQIITWLNIYHNDFESIADDYMLIPNQHLLADSQQQQAEAEAGGGLTVRMLAALGASALETCLVCHCPNAFGLAVTLPQGEKISYSGDTIPCDEMIKLAADSTVLVHEATMEDSLEAEARVKMHSTTSQALAAGAAARARHTLLTHFSQRYARLPRLRPATRAGVAFDNMQVTMSDLELLPDMYAPLQMMFADHCIEMDLKAANRARQRMQTPPSPTPRRVSPHVRARDKDATKDKTINNAGAHAASSRASSSSRPSSADGLRRGPAQPYFESHASLLRQQLHGRTVTGVVRGAPKPSRIPVRDPKQSRSRQSTSPMSDLSVSSPENVPSTMKCYTRSHSASGSSTSFRNRSADRGKSPSSLPSITSMPPTHSSYTTFTSRPKMSSSVSPVARSLVGEVMVQKEDRRRRSQSPRPASSPPSHCSGFSTGYDKPLLIPINRYPTAAKNNYKMTKSDYKYDMVATPSRGGSIETDTLSKNTTQLSNGRRRESSGACGAHQTLCYVPIDRRSSLPVKTPTRTLKPVDVTGQGKHMTNVMIPKLNSDKRKSVSQTCNTFSTHRTSPTTINKTFMAKSAFANANASFKPQLEDIPSSLIMLRIKEQNQAKRNETYKYVFNKELEESRRELLRKTKEKYQSRQFFEDTRYDKIEGLNWITWK